MSSFSLTDAKRFARLVRAVRSAESALKREINRALRTGFPVTVSYRGQDITISDLEITIHVGERMRPEN